MSVVMVNVIMLNVIMLNVVAPCIELFLLLLKGKERKKIGLKRKGCESRVDFPFLSLSKL